MSGNELMDTATRLFVIDMEMPLTYLFPYSIASQIPDIFHGIDAAEQVS
jgi:hypothetical protein